jgi:hypothetical protein
VNGELRQDGLVLTGTPGGTALQAPPAVIEKMGDLLPTPLKWRVFFSRQECNPAYLKAGTTHDQVCGNVWLTANGHRSTMQA